MPAAGGGGVINKGLWPLFFHTPPTQLFPRPLEGHPNQEVAFGGGEHLQVEIPAPTKQMTLRPGGGEFRQHVFFSFSTYICLLLF